MFNALTKLDVTPVHCSRQYGEDCKSGSHELDTLQMIWVRFPRIAPLLFLIRGSTSDRADVDIQ